jgi:hypothetical protein
VSAFILALSEKLFGFPMPSLLPFKLSPEMFTVLSALNYFFFRIFIPFDSLLILSVDVSNHSILSLVGVLLSEERSLKCFDALAKFIELSQQTLVVILQLMSQLIHSIPLPLLLGKFLSPVFLTFTKLCECIVSLVGQSLHLQMQVFVIRI